MRNNKAILDEAARSVRLTFIGSVAGTTVMLAVAGAYGMPKKLTAHAFAAAMTKFNMKFPRSEHAEHAPPVQIADNTKLRTVSDAAPEDAVVRTMPQAEPTITLPATRPAVESTSVFAKTLPAIEATPNNPFTANDPGPAPAVTASVTPPAPDAVEQRPFLSAPMVFELPKPADAQVLTELPKTEVIVAAPQPVAPPEAPRQIEKPAPVTAPVQHVSLAAERARRNFRSR